MTIIKHAKIHKISREWFRISKKAIEAFNGSFVLYVQQRSILERGGPTVLDELYNPLGTALVVKRNDDAVNPVLNGAFHSWESGRDDRFPKGLRLLNCDGATFVSRRLNV